MCGISGIMSSAGKSRLNEQIKAMTGILYHRGPDGEGFYSDGPIRLGHRRLSIIDLSTGDQPMSNEDGRIWVIFNGEIYNFQPLRKELKKRGHVFKTKSDTEVIVHAYEEYGEDCVKKFRGMFAFGIWDSRNRRLFLARDRLGKKPLYYFLDEDTFAFASEIKSILQVENIPKELNLTALKDYFTYLYIPFPETIFRHIYKLPPGHTLSVRIPPVDENGNRNPEERFNLTIKEYWDIEYKPDYSLSEADWTNELEKKLLESIEIRLISDVPLGAFLSGGIDSSTVVAMMSQVSDRPVKTFTIGFEESDFSELEYARIIARRYKTDHHEMMVKPDAIDILPKLTWQYDEPFADPSALPTYYVSKIARENVTVILSGDGGDETFAGYDRYSLFSNYSKFDRIPSKLRKMLFGAVSDILPFGMRGKGTLRHLSRSSFDRYAGMITHDVQGALGDFLHEDLVSALAASEPQRKTTPHKNSWVNLETGRNYPFLRKYYDRFKGNESLSRLQYLDTKTYLAEDILTKVDRASMLCSLETRAPLLDHELLEFIAKMPQNLKLRNTDKKYILKKTMEKHLPREILHRGKMGFDIPLSKWFKRDFMDYSRELLLSRQCRERGILNTGFVKKILNTHTKKGRNLGATIWSLIFFENWCRNWLDQD